MLPHEHQVVRVGGQQVDGHRHRQQDQYQRREPGLGRQRPEIAPHLLVDGDRSRQPAEHFARLAAVALVHVEDEPQQVQLATTLHARGMPKRLAKTLAQFDTRLHARQNGPDRTGGGFDRQPEGRIHRHPDLQATNQRVEQGGNLVPERFASGIAFLPCQRDGQGDRDPESTGHLPHPGRRRAQHRQQNRERHEAEADAPVRRHPARPFEPDEQVVGAAAQSVDPGPRRGNVGFPVEPGAAEERLGARFPLPEKQQQAAGNEQTGRGHPEKQFSRAHYRCPRIPTSSDSTRAPPAGDSPGSRHPR